MLGVPVTSAEHIEVTHCDVCGQTTNDIRVFASGLGPASFAYCAQCIERGAEPFMMVVARVYFAGGPHAYFEPHVSNAVTHDGVGYVGLRAVLERYDELHHIVRSAFSE